MGGRPAALLALGVGCVLAASGVAFAAAPFSSRPAQSVAAPAADTAKSVSRQVTLPAPDPVAA